jgi:hypothetical protein
MSYETAKCEQMTNDEIRMTKEARNPNVEVGFKKLMRFSTGPFVIRASSFVRHSDFDIRHSLLTIAPLRFRRTSSW